MTDSDMEMEMDMDASQQENGGLKPTPSRSDQQQEASVSLPAELRQLLGSNWAQLEKDTIELLQKLLQIDTQNFGEDGSEIEAVRLLEGVFKQAGVEYEVVEPKPGRGNIVARVRGDGSSGKGALLLSAHLDTVKAPRENWAAEGWKHDPFGGVIDEEDGGWLYGRGAIDMKHMAAMSSVLLCFVKRNNICLTRDLIFAGLADEERCDSAYGVKYLVENRPELIEADIVFNELGGMSLYIQGTESIMVQIGEKGSCRVKITAHGPGGHGSVWHDSNPVSTIGEVAQKLQTNKLPLHVNPYNTATIESQSCCLPFPKSMVFRQILNPYLSDVVMRGLVPRHLQNSLGPILHNTANPTAIVGGGQSFNQIPTSAHVIVDVRVLPESSTEEAVDEIKKVVGESRFEPRVGADGKQIEAELKIEVVQSRGSHAQDPNTPECKAVLDVMKQVVSNRADGAPICTILCPGGTDSYHYARHPTKTPICLGFTPVRFKGDVAFGELYHGVNERVPLSGLKWGVRVLADTAFILCGGSVAA